MTSFEVSSYNTSRHIKMMRNGEEIVHGFNDTQNRWWAADTVFVNSIKGLQDCAYKQYTREPCSTCDDLDTFINYIHDAFPHITKIQVRTDSFIPDGTYHTFETLQPNLLLFAFTGKTMFEDRFDAVPDVGSSAISLEDYRTSQQLYIRPEGKQIPFLHPDLHGLLIGIHCVPLEFQTFEALYNECQTWPEFIQRVDQLLIEEQVSLPDRFHFYYYWIHGLLNRILTIPGYWKWNITNSSL